MSEEIWKRIPTKNSIKAYFLSDTGKVKSVYKGIEKELTLAVSHGKYCQFHYNVNGKQIMVSVPKVMAQLFSPELVEQLFNIKTRLTKKDIIQIKTLRADGVSAWLIAQQFNIHPATVTKIVNGTHQAKIASHLNIPVKQKPNKLPAEIYSLIESLLKNNQSISSIARHIKVSTSTVFNVKQNMKK